MADWASVSSEAPEAPKVEPENIPGPDGLTANEREAAKIQALHLDRNRVAFSDPRTPPMFVFSALEISGPLARSTVEAGGANPYRWLGGWPIPRQMLVQIPQRPEWANFAWLCVVEIRANSMSWGQGSAVPEVVDGS